VAVTRPVSEQERDGAVSLRPAVGADRDLLYAIFVSAREHGLGLLALPRVGRDALLRMQFEAQARQLDDGHPGAEHSVVLVGGRPAGRLSVSRDGGEIRVLDIALLPEHRRRGVGTGLLTRLQSEAAATGRPLRLEVARSNPAVRLYGRLGFRPTGGDAVHQALEWTTVTADAASTEGRQGVHTVRR
jgi:ribosomal protein S18 acetylase RimI-like enzyme